MRWCLPCPGSVLLVAGLALGAALPGCTTGGSGPQTVTAYTMKDRLRGIEEGQSVDEVHARLGALPVRKPGHPDDPFSTPLHSIEFSSPDGRRVRLEVYVVATRPEKGCPDYRYDDRPVAFVDGRVVGTSWEFVEWRWRDWGGSLAQLRAAQDRVACDRDSGAPSSEEPPSGPGSRS